MAKRKNDTAPSDRAPVTRPEGFKKVSLDVVGFWSPDLGPIYFIPQEATVSDSKLEPKKQSGLIRGVLVQACDALLNSDGEIVHGEPGDRVGVWAKPGMKELKELGGCQVFMFADGEKDTGKPNAMALFDISTSDGRMGDPLPVEDKRTQSAAHASWLAPARS